MKINTKLAIAFLFCFFLSTSSYAMNGGRRGYTNTDGITMSKLTFEVGIKKVKGFTWNAGSTQVRTYSFADGRGSLGLQGESNQLLAVFYGDARSGNLAGNDRLIEVFDTREVDFKAQKSKEMGGRITSNLALRALAPLVKAKLNISFPIDPENGLIIQRDMAEKLLTEAGFDHNYVATLMSDDDMAIADLQRDMEAKKQLEAQLAQAEIARGEAYEKAEFAKHLALPKQVGQTVYIGDPNSYGEVGIVGQIEQIRGEQIQVSIRKVNHTLLNKRVFTPEGIEVSQSDLAFKEVKIWVKASNWVISSGDYDYQNPKVKDFESGYGGKLKPVK